MATANKPEKATKQRGKWLKRRINLPFSNKLGALAKNVPMPRWVRAIGSYFSGAVYELRQVNWPTRRASWSLTLAVLVFTTIMMGFIVALDFGFEQLFKRIIL